MLSTLDPLTYTQGQAGQELQLDVRVSMELGDTADDVLVQFSNFVAYDPSVLKYKSGSVIFGTALDSNPPTNNATKSLDDLDYTSVGALDAGITGVGTPVQETGYVDGSLLLNLAITQAGGTFNITDLLNKQQPGPALLFSVIFDVVTTQIASSSIRLLNDQSFNPDFTPPIFDTKLWNGGSPLPTALVSNVLEVEIQPVPAPAPLALLAAGLIGLALRRRHIG